MGSSILHKTYGKGKVVAIDGVLLSIDFGGTPCTAHDIYYGISEVIFLMQCRGDTGVRLAQMEENIARAFTVRWHDYDVPGEAKW